MKRWCILAVSAGCGYGGWWLATALGAEFFVAFLVSGVASILGVYVGWKLAGRLE